VALGAVILARMIGVAAAPAQQQPTFRSGAKTVAVYATVSDKDGRLVPDVPGEAFEIRDNGKPQPITVFSNEVQPITVVMMLDRSGSMRGNVGLVEQAAEEFVKGLRPDDKARIGIVAERIDIQPAAFSSDRAALLGFLRSELPVTGPTPLWNALDEGMDALSGQKGAKWCSSSATAGDAPPTPGARNRSMADVMRRAEQEDVMLYAIGLQTTVLRGPGGGGARHRRPDRLDDLDPSRSGAGHGRRRTGGGYFESPAATTRAPRSPVSPRATPAERAWFRAGDAGRQDAQARSPGEPARDEGACPEELFSRAGHETRATRTSASSRRDRRRMSIFYRRDSVFETGPRRRRRLGRARRCASAASDLRDGLAHLPGNFRSSRASQLHGIIGHEVFAEIVTAPDSRRLPRRRSRHRHAHTLVCGTCRACRMGAGQVCYRLKVMGVDLPGGMQDYWTVPVDRLLALPGMRSATARRR
jgi:VWFA-related protein